MVDKWFEAPALNAARSKVDARQEAWRDLVLERLVEKAALEDEVEL